MPATGRGVLSSSVSPSDWASRRAGSMVSTTTRRPASAARRPSAAAVVVLPTPPEPQQTMMPVAGSASRASMPMSSGAVRPAVRGPGGARGAAGAGGHQRTPWASSSSASTAMPPSSMPLREHGQGEGGQALRGDLVGQRALELDPLGVVVGLARAGRSPSWRRRAPPRRRGRRAPGRATRSGSAAAVSSSASSTSGSRTWLTIDGAEAEPGIRQLADRVDGLLHRHLLEQGHDVHHALPVAQHPGDRLGLASGSGPSGRGRPPAR